MFDLPSAGGIGGGCYKKKVTSWNLINYYCQHTSRIITGGGVGGGGGARLRT